MNDFLKMDVFFIVTTAVVLILGVMSIIALYYVIRMLQNVGRITRNAANESDEIRTDIALLRNKLREEGMKVKYLVDFFLGMKGHKESKTKKESKE